MKLNLRISSIVLSTMFAASAHAAPTNLRTEEQLEADIKTRVLPNAQHNYNATESKVTDLTNHVAQVQQHALDAKDAKDLARRLTADGTTDNYYRFRLGAESSEVQDAISEDQENIQGGDYDACQDGDMPSWEQVNEPPEIESDGCKYYVHSPSRPVGVCLHFDPDPFCGVFITAGDLVEYYFPTFKIDLSENPYQSNYLDSTLVETAYEPINSEMMIAAGSVFASRNANIVGSITKETMAAHGIDVPQVTPGLAPSKEADAVTNLPLALQAANPNQQRIYSRFITEGLNLETTSRWWIPHVPVPTWWGSDEPPYFALASRSLDINLLPALASSTKVKSAYAAWQSAGGNAACVLRNTLTGKSPIELAQIAAGANGQALQGNSSLCLDNIGERFPFTDTRRVNITDRTWRGIAKDLELWQTVVDSRHTFNEETDKLKVLRNQTLRSEQPECGPLKAMAKKNLDYGQSNVKEIGSGGEMTMEVFTKFTGCWGFKGVDRPYWHVITGPGNLRLK